MIDTIQLRLHGILEKRTDTLSEIQHQNKKLHSLYFFPAHYNLYKSILKYEGKFSEQKVFQHKETGKLSEVEDESFFAKRKSAKDKKIKYTQKGFFRNKNR